MPSPNHLSPLTPEERRRRVAALLATGLVRLNCTPDVLTRLRLCGTRAHCFAEDIRRITEQFGARADVLEQMCWPG
jgi:hypothetical protein